MILQCSDRVWRYPPSASRFFLPFFKLCNQQILPRLCLSSAAAFEIHTSDIVPPSQRAAIGHGRPYGIKWSDKSLRLQPVDASWWVICEPPVTKRLSDTSPVIIALSQSFPSRTYYVPANCRVHQPQTVNIQSTLVHLGSSYRGSKV